MNKRQRKKKRNKEIYRDTWSLDWATANFLLPRLIMFKKVNNGLPYSKSKNRWLTEDEWDEVLDTMIDAFTLIKKGNWAIHDYERPIVDKGLDLFREYYFELWW